MHFFLLFLNNDNIPTDTKERVSLWMMILELTIFFFKVKKEYLSCKKRSGEDSTQVKNQK